jgi:two-component system sensor histidine kinase CpxA
VREKKPTIMYHQVDIAASLKKYFKRTAYADQIVIGPLKKVYVNEALFCTAIDNLVRNGLKYNDSETKWIRIEQEDDYTITITDNGRGMTQEEFESYSQAYKRGTNQEESGTGLGLNISIAIFKEHYFEVSAEKLEVGTKIRIKM